MQLRGKKALITGAGRGIGQAIARAYAREGASLALAARSLAELEQTAGEARALGACATVIQVDVTDKDAVEAMAKKALEDLGQIDILVNNAGIVGPIGALEDNDVEAWVRTIQVNLVGTYLCCRSVIPAMARSGGGRIINLSGSGATSAPYHLSAYGSSKAAIIRLTEILSLELADKNIQVNAIAPGLTESEGVKANTGFDMARAPTIATRSIKREMLPEDLLGTLMYLATSDSDFVTGQTLNVDGGKVNV